MNHMQSGSFERMMEEVVSRVMSRQLQAAGASALAAADPDEGVTEVPTVSWERAPAVPCYTDKLCLAADGQALCVRLNQADGKPWGDGGEDDGFPSGWQLRLDLLDGKGQVSKQPASRLLACLH